MDLKHLRLKTPPRCAKALLGWWRNQKKASPVYGCKEKNKKILRGGIFLFALAMFLFLPQKVFAQVVINEFLVNPVASEQEWVELFNNSDEIVNLADWKITDESGSNLNLSGCIISKGFRSFFHGEGWLNNTGDTITLKNSESSESEEDKVVYGNGEVIGIPGEGKSEARDPDGGTSWKLVDSPSPQNNDCFLPTSTLTPIPTEVLATATPAPTNTPTGTPANTPAPNSYENIFVSEFMVDPESGNEWAELFNDNDSEVNLFGWSIDDISGGGSSPIPISGTIPANSYKQFYLSSAFLNNDGDDVRLLDGGQTEKDKKSFSSSTKGKSWAKDSSENWCQQDPTPNAANANCSTPTPVSSPTSIATPTPQTTPTPTPSSTPSVTGQVLGQEQASASGQFETSGQNQDLANATKLEEDEIKKLYSPPEKKNSFLFPLITISGGVGLVSYAIWSYLKPKNG